MISTDFPWFFHHEHLHFFGRLPHCQIGIQGFRPTYEPSATTIEETGPDGPRELETPYRRWAKRHWAGEGRKLTASPEEVPGRLR